MGEGVEVRCRGGLSPGVDGVAIEENDCIGVVLMRQLVVIVKVEIRVGFRRLPGKEVRGRGRG